MSILICTSQADSMVTKEPHQQQFPHGGMHNQPPTLASWLPTDEYPAEAWPPECHCLCVSCLYLGNHLPGEWWPVFAFAHTTHTPQSGCCSHARCPRHHPQPCRSLPSVKSRAGSCRSQAIPTCPSGSARKAQPWPPSCGMPDRPPAPDLL